MNASEQQIRLAAQLYDVRDTMRRFLRDKYPAQMAKYKGYIETAKARWSLDTIPAAMRLVAELQKRHDGSMSQPLVIAAAVEMIEPTEVKP